jgi:hypothetical protein
MPITITTDAVGPIFNGRAERAAVVWTKELKDEIGKEGLRLVQGELAHVLRNPTGFYQSNVTLDRSYSDVAVTDNGVIYGPWLEGVGSRNATTRFKGYFTFRRMTYKLQQRAPQIAQKNMKSLLKAMGG